MTRSTRAMLAAACALSTSTLMVPASASGQTGPPSDTTFVTVEGEVLDAVTGLPLPGVMVAMHDIWRLTWTDELGYFMVDHVPQGPHEFGVYGLGYLTVEEYIDFDGAETFGVHLSPAPVELQGLTVEVLSQQGFEYRSFGQRYDFIGPDLMEEYRVKYGKIEDMLHARFPGIRVWNPGGPGSGICIRNQRGSTSMYGGESDFGCALMFIDGLEADPNTVATLHPEAIEAIQFIARLEARLVWGERGRYGVLLIETRRGGR